MKNKYIKSSLATLVSLSIPTILEEVLATLLQYVDTAMVGHLGEKATASVSTTTTIGWLIHSIPGAVAVALLALASKANGAGKTEKLRRLAGQSILFAFFIGAILEIIAILAAPYIPIWMGVEADIVKPAGLYFSITSTTLVFRASSRIFAAMIRSTKDTKSPMLVSVSENILNVILNYCFIYILGLSVTGAAIASAISYGVGGIAMFFLMLSKKRLMPLRCDLRFDVNIFKEVFSIGVPTLATTIINCLGYIVFAGMVSGMGTTIFAAHSIAITAEQIVYIPGSGIKAATSTLVGNALGEGNKKKINAIEKVAIILTVMIMLINGLALFFFSYPLMRLFTSSNEVAYIGSKMLKLVAFSEPFFGLMNVLEGISFGMGKVKHIFICEAGSMWGIRILFTFICVKILGLGLTSVWLCMIADNIVKAILLYFTRPRYNNVSIITH